MAYQDELIEWTYALERAWNQLETRERELVNEEMRTKFEQDLQLLKSELQNRNSNYDYSLYTHSLYEMWNKINMSRKEEYASEKIPLQPVPIGGHQLPPLPYEYDALEPYIIAEIMRLHHQEHHQSYVDGLNKAERMMEQARRTRNYELIKHWEREAAFHGAGHYLHTIFWNNMSPKGGGEPTGKFLQQINQDFGSFQQFKEHFSEAANKVEGVGWAILVWAPRAHRLEILQAEKHQNLSQWDVIPLLALDVWEHAYYLQYKNERKEYINNWWNVVNWPNVHNRFKKAKELRWLPY